MASNFAKTGRLPPIADLGLGQLPRRKLADIAANGDVPDSRDQKHADPFCDRNALLKGQECPDPNAESTSGQGNMPKQSMFEVVEKANRKKNLMGSSRKVEKTRRKEKDCSGFNNEQNENKNSSKNIALNSRVGKPEELAALENFYGKYEVEQGSGADSHQHKPQRVISVSRNASELTEETTLHGSTSIDSNDNCEGLLRVDYRELAVKLANDYNRPATVVKRRRKFVDYVLVFSKDDDSEFNESQRQSFEGLLETEGIDVSRCHIGNHVYVELCCSFDRLCQEAEAIFLEMPLVGFSLHHDNTRSTSCWRAFESEKEVDDICLPFCNATKEIYHAIDDKNNFFRPGIRSLLVHQILKTVQLSEEESSKHRNVEALAYLLHEDVYSDAYILHERSSLDPHYPLTNSRRTSVEYPTENDCNPAREDRRKDLHETWLANFKFQPLWKIRNYFGEKIALYFAWLGMLITSLWVPTVIGLIVFIYGIIYAFSTNNSGSWIRIAFDNDLTPGFALMICLWGTVFLELWKRKNAGLAYKWDVDAFEQQEPNRPQFYSTELKMNPITGLNEPFYSPIKKTLKSMGSMVLISFMVLLVLASLIAVIVYRIIARVDWFNGTNGILLSNLTSSVLNSTSIMLLGYFYKYLGKKLTEWENHRTQTQYDDSLILKLFGFQFVNSYSSLYYIAFFRERTSEGILGRGKQYTDSCGTSNDCMSLLSIQVGILMLMKPMPKFCSDIIAPLLLKFLRSIRRKIRRKKVVCDGSFVEEAVSSDAEFEDFLQHERRKPDLKDFTLSEYTEKVIQYGYLMLFAAACPLAPLIALVTNMFDLRIDARRLLWLNRRPVPRRSQDIGMWYTILQLLNYIGIITNAFIIAVTSAFGGKYEKTTVFNVISNTTSLNSSASVVNTTTITVKTLQNLWIIIIFQNVSFIVRFILEYSIPDEPESVKMARKREQFIVEGVLKKAGFRRGKGKSIVPAITKNCQIPGEHALLTNRPKRKGDSMKDKIRKISSQRKKGEELRKNSRKKHKQVKEIYMNDDSYDV